MNKFIFLLVLSISLFSFSAVSQAQDYSSTLTGILKVGIPVTAEFSPQINDTTFFLGNVSLTLDSYTDEDVVVCIQEEPLPLPNFEKYKTSCSYTFTFKANPNPHTTTSTTGHATTSTTGHATTSTTGHATTSTTGHATTSTTGHATTSTTGHATTSTTGHATTSTTGHVTTSTTGHATTSTTGHATTGNATTTANATTGHHATTGTLKRLGGGRRVVFNVGDDLTKTFTPRSRNLVAGIYYANSAATHKQFNVTFQVKGKFCNNATGDDCKTPINILPNNTTADIATISYFSYVVSTAPVNDTWKTLSVDFHPHDNKTVTIYARFAGIPSKDNHDATSNNSLILVAPRLGTWLFAVEVSTATTVQPVSTQNFCNNSAGLDCKASITKAGSLADKFTQGKLNKSNDIAVYSFPNIPYNALYVSLYDSNKDKKASIYASFNRIAYVDGSNKVVGADISGCNNQYCNQVQSISSKNGYMGKENGTWYVTIVAGRDSNDYAFWFDFICPNNCSKEGDCGTGADNYGVCKCNQNYDQGLKCEQNNMLIEYIILIIIAALVLVSALLGLIAWAYMRRRAQYVEVR